MAIGAEDRATGSLSERAARTLRRLYAAPPWSAPRVSVLRVDPSSTLLPEPCACCGGRAAEGTRETRAADGHALIVPYCSDCSWHVSASATRAMALGLSSAVFALTLSAALPLLWTFGSIVGYAAVVLAGAALPLVVARAIPRSPRIGHTAPGRAAWFAFDGRLACTSAPWAEALARASGAPVDRLRLREPSGVRWGLLGPGVALAAIPLFYPSHFPTVRIVNLTETVLSIESDGRRIVTVSPTSQESPAAGAVVRLPAGERHLAALSPDGRVISEARVRVESRAAHLYAPGSGPHCFWLESTTYGRGAGASGRPVRTVHPLSGAARFWALREPIDTWFGPNPTTASDSRSTGGRLVALRQARCLEAPAAVREVASE